MTEQKPSTSEQSSEIKDLRRILEVTSIINSTLNLDELLEIIMTTSAEVMKIEAASLMLLNPDTQELSFEIALGDKGTLLKEKHTIAAGEGIAGAVAQTGESVILNDPSKDKRFAKKFDDQTGFITRAMLCVPMKAKGKMIGVLQALNPSGRHDFSAHDLQIFEIFSDQAAIAIENARLHQESVEREKAKQELAIAKKIQQNFLPKLDHLKLKNDVAAISDAALEVGGDFYDVVEFTDKRQGFVIADVSGKGVPAALYMVRAISDFRFLSPRHHNPKEVLQALNQELTKTPSFGMFVTFLYFVLDQETHQLQYASAGHPPILKLSKNTSEAVELKDAGGMPLGLTAKATFSQNSIDYTTGDFFLVYTDGIIEARNQSGEEFGIERLKQTFAEAPKNAKSAVSHVLTTVETFSHGARRHDDMTLIALRIS